jgi:N-acyl-phosphatidylethanolamine-hydrolysing phospholipase D
MRWQSNWAKHHDLAGQVPIRAPDLERIAKPGSGIQVTWIGHSTFLIQLNGIAILTDPVFSDRASPVGFAGPRRYVPPALSLAQLPTIDYVIVSHNHYDHMDLNTIADLAAGPTWLVPLKNAPYLRNVGVKRVIELDWWDRHRCGDLLFTATPAQHWSARGIFDRCDALWSGWAISNSEHAIYFAGDTGYNAVQFKEIGTRLGPFDIGLIPIGAYEPRWFMKDMHVNPHEAVKIHLDTGSKQSFAMHWGTFPLTAEPPGDPPIELAKALDDARLSPSQFLVLDIGETWSMDESNHNETSQIL